MQKITLDLQVVMSMLSLINKAAHSTVSNEAVNNFIQSVKEEVDNQLRIPPKPHVDTIDSDPSA